MSRLTISSNLFLEKAELDKLQDFLLNNQNVTLFSSVTSQFGIIPIPDNSGNDFLIEAGSTNGTIKMNTDSKALDSDMLLVNAPTFDNFEIPNDSNVYWLKIAHKYVRYETGMVNININGEVSGTGTSFLDTLRGQSTGIPTKVRFFKENNNFVQQTVVNDGVYEVIDVASDTLMTLAGNFTAENNLRYVTVGSYTLGTQLTTEQEDGIYNYDNIEYTLVSAVDENTAPTSGFIGDKEFYIAAVRRSGSTVTIWDRRSNYYWTIDFGATLTTKADTDAGNITPSTYSAGWWELVNHWNNSVQTIDVGDVFDNEDQFIDNSTSIVKINADGNGGGATNIYLPDATLPQNVGKSIYFIIEANPSIAGEEITVMDGIISLFHRVLYNSWYENIIVRSNGANWYVVQSNIQGTVDYPGVWEKASTTEMLNSTSNKVVTADNIASRTASTSRVGLQRNATGVEARELSNNSINITPSSLGSVTGGLIYSEVEIGSWDMDTDASVDIDVTSAVDNANKIRQMQVYIYADSGSFLDNSQHFLMKADPTDAASAYAPQGFWDTSSGLTSEVRLFRLQGGFFDSISFNSTSINRGIICIWHQP